MLFNFLALMLSRSQGKFSIAAKHHMTIAEMFEAEDAVQQNLEGALKHYETAADYYRGEEAQRCVLFHLTQPLSLHNFTVLLHNYFASVHVAPRTSVFKRQHISMAP